MASPARELHEQTRTGHRGSSPRLAHPQRPRLRSCVTAPSITTSNACREALASPQSAERATDLLSRVAVVTSPSVRAMPSQIEAAPDTLLALAVATATEGQEMGDAEKAYPGCYFSFPGFESWDGEAQAGKENQGLG